jgi:hypothetical protein
VTETRTKIDVLVLTPGSFRAEPWQVPATLEAFQGLVGGLIEALSLGDHTSAYINEEGKFEGLARNEAADKFVRHALAKIGRTMIPGDYVAGPLVITGQPDGDGYDTGVGDEAYQLLAEVGIPIGGEGPVVQVTRPDDLSTITEPYGRDGRGLVTKFPTSIPDVYLHVSTSHWKDRKQFASYALGVRHLPRDGIFSAELSSPMEGVQVRTEPVARFSAKALQEAHIRALSVATLAIEEGRLDKVILATPKRD